MRIATCFSLQLAIRSGFSSVEEKARGGGRGRVVASDCSKTFYSKRGNSALVLELGGDGCFAERFSFPTPEGKIVAASKKHIFAMEDKTQTLLSF